MRHQNLTIWFFKIRVGGNIQNIANLIIMQSSKEADRLLYALATSTFNLLSHR